MVNTAKAVLNAASKNAEKTAVVLTSSTGSTNPPDAAGDAIKNELEFWSDPEFQKSKGKFSPAAKTLMEIEALKFVGRNQGLFYRIKRVCYLTCYCSYLIWNPT